MARYLKSFQIAALLALLLPTLVGCDALGLGGSTWEGIVVSAATGEPIEGINVSLQVGGGGFGAYSVVESVATDRKGEFTLHTSRQDTALYVNSYSCYFFLYCPNVSEYIGSGPILYAGKKMRIELSPDSSL